MEDLERRTLLTTYITLSVPGALPLQVVSGSSVTVTADVRQIDNGTQVNADPTGTVYFTYFNDYGAAGRVLATSSNFTVITPYLDSRVTATLTLTPPFGDGAADSFGDFLILAAYGNDANLPGGASYIGGGNQVSSGDPSTRTSPTGQYIPVDFVAAPSTDTIAVTAQPTNADAGAKLNPPVQVSVLTAAGSVDTTSTASITVALASSSTGAGTLGGTTTVAAVAGVATFPDLSVDKAGQYALAVTDAAGDTATSATFQVGGDHLEFAQPPTTTAAGKAIDPAVTVAVKDATETTDASATGSVTLTLASASRLGTSPGTLGGTATEPLVGGVATFSDLTVSADGTYTLTATDSDATIDSVPSGKFRVGPSDLTVELNSRLVIRNKGGSAAKGAQSGDQILYSVLVRPKKAVQTADVVVTLPAGFVPAGITAGGTFAGDTITWTANTRVYDFDTTVPSDEVLNGLTKITTSVDDNVTYTDGDADEATATNSVKLAASFEVKGNVNDAQFKYPQILTISTSHALPRVTVNLIDSTGATVDSDVTKGDGSFSVSAVKGGTYTIEFVALTDSYATAANGLSNRKVYVGQTVTIPASSTKPIDLGHVIVPKTFLDSSARILRNLNNYSTSGFQNLGQFNVNFLQFDTTGAESALAALAGTAADPVAPPTDAAIHGGTVAEDPWVSAMRMMAGLAEVDQRFADTKAIVDQAGKAFAVMLSAQFSAFVGKNVVGKFGRTLSAQGLNPTLWTNSIGFGQLKANQAARVAGFTALGSFLPTSLDLAGVSASNKSSILAAVFTTLRYLSDIVSGKLVDDLGFEAVFNLIRITLDAAVLEVVTGAKLRPDFATPEALGPIPAQYAQYLNAYTYIAPILTAVGSAASVIPGSMQAQINQIVANRTAYNPHPLTDQTLTALNGFDDNLHDEAIKGLRNTAFFNSLAGTVRATQGVATLQGLAGSSLGATQAATQGYLTRFNAAVDKLTPSGSTNINRDLAVLVFGSALFSLVEQAAAATDIPTIVNTGVVTGIFSDQLTGLTGFGEKTGPLTPTPTVGHLHPTGAARPPALVRPAAAAAAAAADVTPYLADLDKLSALVKAGNLAGVTAELATYRTDDTALFNGDLILLDSRSAAALPLLAKAPQASTASRRLVSTYDAAVQAAVTATQYMELQLGAWGGNPATADVPAVTKQIALAQAAVAAAVNAAGPVRSLVAGVTLPATLTIDETAVPTNPTANATQPFTFTITNVGSQASAAGTVTFTNSDGTLAVQGPAQQSLPALAAGASATVTWQVQVAAPATAGFGSAFQVAASAGDATATTADTVYAR